MFHFFRPVCLEFQFQPGISITVHHYSIVFKNKSLVWTKPYNNLLSFYLYSIWSFWIYDDLALIDIHRQHNVATTSLSFTLTFPLPPFISPSARSHMWLALWCPIRSSCSLLQSRSKCEGHGRKFVTTLIWRRRCCASLLKLL